MYHWNIPVEGGEGTIEHQISGKVLGLTNNGTGAEVIWQTKDESISVSQKWLRVISTGYIFQGSLYYNIHLQASTGVTKPFGV